MASAQTTLSTRPEAPPTAPGSVQDTVTRMATRRRRLTLAYWLSGLLAVVALVASAVGVFYPAVFRDSAVTAGNARGTDLVILVVAIPALVIAMALTARGSLRAQIVWLGALGYILYNAIFFAFAVAFNPLFLVYIAVLSLALWSLVALLMALDVAKLRAHFTEHLPIRAIALYLLVTTALFALTWLRDIVPALVSNTTPISLQGTKMLTNPIQVVDFAVSFPLTVLAAVWLWQRKVWGYALAGLFLVYCVIEAISVATDQFFGHLSDPTQSVVMAPVFAVIAVIAAVPLVLYFRCLRRDATASASRQAPRMASVSWPPA
ncbi:MAG TPA: hypothetical protein VFW17_04065 [Ktedonobacterales bacterium]|jgi:hypothetical protein|nr:hypothetical protein [Ktedonobacterales bacterium]